MPANTVYVGRPSRWGNYSGDGSHAGYAVAAFRHDLERGFAGLDRSLSATDAKNELRGKNLACWCKAGDPCHADVLLELANK